MIKMPPLSVFIGRSRLRRGTVMINKSIKVIIIVILIIIEKIS